MSLVSKISNEDLELIVQRTTREIMKGMNSSVFSSMISLSSKNNSHRHFNSHMSVSTSVAELSDSESTSVLVVSTCKIFFKSCVIMSCTIFLFSRHWRTPSKFPDGVLLSVSLAVTVASLGIFTTKERGFCISPAISEVCMKMVAFYTTMTAIISELLEV